MTEIPYASGYTAEVVPVSRRGILGIAPGQSASGYGRKISTDYMVRLAGEKQRRRVYVVCYSNAGSLYIIVAGKPVYLRGHELEGALGR